ncbi:MAG: DEAD/DEAH box helicase, partial [Quisquiliibacterium sp.]
AVLCVLGDLLHAPAAHTPLVIDALANWRARHQALRVLLVRGNHDDRAGDPPPRCDIQVVDEPYAFAGLALRHMPPRQQAGLRGPTHALAGHLHPVVSIASRHDRVRLPCFLVQDDCLVLPAFGDFTGGWPVDPAGAATVFPTDGERVYQLPRTSDATMRRR